MRTRASARALAITLCTGLLLTAVEAAEAVDRFVDAGGGSDGGNDCTNSGNPCATIGRAIDAAVDGDQIQIAAGVYTERLQIDKALTLLGEDLSTTIVQAATARGVASERTVTIADDVDVTLFNLTVRHGNTTTDGGGVFSEGGFLNLQSVLITDNDAAQWGAGLSAGGDGATVLLANVVVRNNGTAATERGGGLDLGRNFTATTVQLNNVEIVNNTAAQAGGMSVFNAQVSLRDVVFEANSATGGNGGGLFYGGSNSVTSNLVMQDTVFRANSAGGDGGGMYTVSDDTPYSLSDVLFSGNYADGLGGGICNENASNNPRILTNVTLSSNRAGTRGGAIGEASGPLFIRNTIIWNNLDGNGADSESASLSDFFSSDIVSVDNSLIQNFSANAFTGNDNLDGTNPANDPGFLDPSDPLLAPTTDGNFRFQFASPVRDQGNNAFVLGGAAATDLDGQPRIVGPAVDLGPYERSNQQVIGLIFADGFE